MEEEKYYSPRNFCVSGLCPPSGILSTAKHSVSGAGSASVVGWRGDAPALLGPGPTEVIEVSCYLRNPTEGVSLPSPGGGCGSGCRNVVFSGIWNSGRRTESGSPVILSVIHHH
jgi:hypothetical protein